MCDVASPRIAIFDADAGMLDMYRELLDEEGARMVAHADAAQIDANHVRELLRESAPQAVIWDVAPPYSVSLGVLRDLLDRGDLDRRTLIVTTTDKLQVDGLLHDASAIVLAKPFDIDEVAKLLKRGTPRSGSP